jgi:hypothetical protein
MGGSVLEDPEGTGLSLSTRRGVEGELPQRVADARYEQHGQAQDDRDTEGVGDTVRGWFRKAHR